MKAARVGDTRHILITGLPKEIGGHAMPDELEIRVTYTGDTGMNNAVALDQVVIPAIVELLNAEHDSSHRMMSDIEALAQLTDLCQQSGISPCKLRELFNVKPWMVKDSIRGQLWFILSCWDAEVIGEKLTEYLIQQEAAADVALKDAYRGISEK